MYWRPLPNGPPAPSLNGVSIFASAPPFGASTRPVRSRTTLTPASSATRAADSHATPSTARKSLPAAVDSSTSSSPCGP
jgi:hypothetical protein